MDIRKSYFSETTVMHWHRLPRAQEGGGVTMSPSLKVLRTVGMWHCGVCSVGMVSMGWWLDLVT